MEPIFDAGTVSHEAERRKERAFQEISDLSQVRNVQQTADRIFKKVAIPPVALRREDADPFHRPVPGRTEVTYAILIDGEPSTSRLKLSDGHSTPVGEFRGVQVVRVKSFDADSFNHVLLTKTFPEPSRDEVLAWAKDLTDRLEARLARVLQEVDAVNQSLRSAIATKVEERKAALDAGKGLGNLGRGI